MRLAVCVALCALTMRPARGDDRPWAAGVSPAAQAEALREFEAGNILFERGQYREALEVYRRGIASWDHPAIRYNMAVARIQLDQPLPAYQDLDRALRYGAAPHEPGVHDQALTYRKLLLGQLGQLTVVCRERGAQVLLDGEVLLVGPGEATRVLLPGAHQLVASKLSYVSTTRALTLVAGRPAHEEIELVALPPPVHLERRWSTWKPWVVIGAGAVVALAGVPLQLDAAATIDEYDAAFGASCPQGCAADDAPASVRDLKRRARLENRVAISLFAVGAAIATSGVVMVLLNQPREVPRVSVAATPAGVFLSGAF